MKFENHPYRLDSNESAFFTRELEHIKARTYDVKYKALKAFGLFPISSEAGNGITEITYQSFRGVGFAKIIADYAKDFPRVDVYGSEVSRKVKGIGDSYAYSIKEIRQSQRTGKRLDQRRASMARRASDQVVNDIAFNGLSDHNIPGFINYPGIVEYTVPADGTGSSKLWSTKSPDQIIRDVSEFLVSIVDLTNGIEQPDTLLLPIDQYNRIATTRVTDGDSNTIMKFILETSPYLKSIEWVTEMKAAGASGTDRMMCYPKDEEHLTLEIPQPFEQFDSEKTGMEFKIPCHQECAGVIIYYPLSVGFADGI